MSKSNPRVAIVSDMSLQRLALAHAVKGQGYDLVLNSSRSFGCQAIQLGHARCLDS